MNYFKSTAENIRSLEKDDALVLCSSLIPLIHEIGSKYNIKFFDNYFYRTYAIYNETKQIWEDIQLGEKRTGRDAYSQKYSLKDIEFKTGNDDKEGDPLKTSFMWDKQSESIRRTETLGSDAFVLGRFEHEVLRIILIAREEKTLQHIRSIMENKQKDFLEKWNKNIADGKRGGSDAIRISYTLFVR
jgi:hypothetical protein